MELTIETVASGWDKVLETYRRGRPARVATRHGISFDFPGLTIWLQNPGDLTAPAGYLYPELIKDYRDRLFGDQRDKSLLYQRMRRWRNGDAPAFDQLQKIEELLRLDSNTRSAVFSAWQPTEDLGADFPVSPVDGCFRLVRGELILLLTARRVDVWVGLVPELLAFAQLTMDMTVAVGARSSRISYHCWSAHLYEVDYLSYLAGR